MSKVHKYRERQSKILGAVNRPLIDLEIFSETENRWLTIEDVLVDTGADASVLPYSQGALFVKSVESGERTDVSGIVPYARLAVYFHNLKMKMGSDEFEVPVLIAESDEVPPILGRVKGIDRFLAEFDKGKELRIS